MIRISFVAELEMRFFKTVESSLEEGFVLSKKNAESCLVIKEAFLGKFEELREDKLVETAQLFCGFATVLKELAPTLGIQFGAYGESDAGSGFLLTSDFLEIVSPHQPWIDIAFQESGILPSMKKA